MRNRLVSALRKAALDETTPRDQFDARDATGAIPLIGGAVHGGLKPAEGTSRAESGLIQGMTGLGGGLAGGLAGAGAAGTIGYKLGARNEGLGAMIALGMLAGSSAGTLGGSLLGRFAARRDVLTATDLKRLAGQAGIPQQQA